MPIDTKHPEYTKASEAWEMMTAVTSGSRAVKQLKEVLLPRPNKDDRSKEANARYENYLARALFYEYTKDTGLKYQGLAFKKDPALTLDDELEALKTNIDGAGLSIYQQAQKVFSSQLKHARCGLYVDYPQSDISQSKAEQQQLGLRPYITFYSAHNIINWSIKTINNKVVTSEVVLQETYYTTDTEDKFKKTEHIRWRYLALDEKNQYFVEVYEKSDSGDVVQIGETVYPTNHKNQYWNIVPFQIIGSQVNDWSIQDIPLEPLANIDLAIYRNSADNENSIFLLGQAQPYMSGVTQPILDYYAKKEKEDGFKIRIGAENIMMLGDGGQLGFAQASPNSMAREGIQDKRQTIVELGAQLGQAGSAVKTATQSENEAQSQYSKASLCVANLNEAYYNALTWCNEFSGAIQEPKFVVTQDFVEPVVDMMIVSGLSAQVDAGKLPIGALFDYYRKVGLVDGELADEELIDLISTNPVSLSLRLDDERKPTSA